MAITLYDLAGAEDDRRFSPYCWRVKMALRHKGLPFETVPWRFTDKEVIAFSGSKTVPVLVDGGQAVYDSWAIAEYLEEAYPSRPGLFESSESLALSFFINHWTARALHVPLLRAGLATASLLVFVEVMKELPATLLLRPLGGDTLAIAVWQATSESLFETAALPALLIVLVGLLPVALMIRLSGRAGVSEVEASAAAQAWVDDRELAPA